MKTKVLYGYSDLSGWTTKSTYFFGVIFLCVSSLTAKLYFCHKIIFTGNLTSVDITLHDILFGLKVPVLSSITLGINIISKHYY